MHHPTPTEFNNHYCIASVYLCMLKRNVLCRVRKTLRVQKDDVVIITDGHDLDLVTAVVKALHDSPTDPTKLSYEIVSVVTFDEYNDAVRLERSVEEAVKKLLDAVFNDN